MGRITLFHLVLSFPVFLIILLLFLIIWSESFTTFNGKFFVALLLFSTAEFTFLLTPKISARLLLASFWSSFALAFVITKFFVNPISYTYHPALYGILALLSLFLLFAGFHLSRHYCHTHQEPKKQKN